MIPYKTDLVQINKFSRPGIKLLGVLGIILHWTGNKGATDENHVDYFDGPDGGGERYASAHFFVDRDSATLIIPLDEVAYHANDMACRIPKLKATAPDYKSGNANLNTIGIEMCVEKDGTIHSETIARTVQLTSHLCTFYKLKTIDIYRHYDVTGKNCPAPWVSDPVQFDTFKNRVEETMNPPKTATVSSTAPGQIRYIYTGGYAGPALQQVHNYLFTTGHNFDCKRAGAGSIVFLIGRFDTSQANFKDCENFLKKGGHAYKLLTPEEAAKFK